MPGVSDPGPLTYGPFRYFPVLPGRLEFAIEVRRALLRERPKVVAVELPYALEDEYRRAIKRLPQLSVIVWPDESSEIDDEEGARGVYVPVEVTDPFIEAARTAQEIGAEVVFVEPDLTEKPHIATAAPDPYSIRFIGYDAYVENYRKIATSVSDEELAHANGIAWKLQGADPLASVFVVLSLNMLEPVLAAVEVPQDPPERSQKRVIVDLINPHPDCLAEILIEYPYLQHRYEQFRQNMDDYLAIDRPRVQLDVYRHAEDTYHRETGDEVVYWQRQLLARYTRNLAILDQTLTADVFDIAIAARSIVDDNYGYETWQSLNRYPSQQIDSDLETVNLSGDAIWMNTRKLRLRRRLPRFKQRVRPSALKKRKKEARPGEWAEQLDGASICSYPPEDLVVENYGKFLKSKAKSILSDERERVEQFRTSLLDGIDMRETLRNWHQKKIYVHTQEKIFGDVGSVVVIFDEDKYGDKYNYLTTWLGEHQNESDMAFYATHPFDHLVGPGIGRAEYGGFLMTLPPRRMFDVWSDPDYEFAETKAERLLLAGIDYSVQKIVVYVAKHPPRSVFRSIAARMGQKILYIPIGQLSPTKLKQVRVVHVLDSHARRAEAKDYIW